MRYRLPFNPLKDPEQRAAWSARGTASSSPTRWRSRSAGRSRRGGSGSWTSTRTRTAAGSCTNTGCPPSGRRSRSGERKKPAFQKEGRFFALRRSLQGEVVHRAAEEVLELVAGDVGVQALAHALGGAPSLPRTRPSGEVMPSMASTDMLGFVADVERGVARKVHVLRGDLAAQRQVAQGLFVGDEAALAVGDWPRCGCRRRSCA